MKKVLLPLAVLSLSLSANAQLLTYGFEESDDQSKLQPVNWENYATSQYNVAYTEVKHSGERSLYAITEGTCETYNRVVSIFNIGFKEEKSYRVSFYSKGKGSVNVTLLKGCYNHDLALQAGNGSTFVDQMYDCTMTSQYSRNTFVFWSPRREDMDAKRKTLSWLNDDQKQDMMKDSIWNQDFLRFSFNTEGNFSIDDVVIEEASIAGITFNASGDGSVLYVDFGYEVNVKELAGAEGRKLDPSLVKVTVDGDEVEISSVEALSNGHFCIFTAEEIDAEAKVAVSFTNSGDLKYSTNRAPFCFTEPNAAVLNFVNEPAVFDAGLQDESIDFAAARLVSTEPANPSFELDPTISTFSFTFNMPVRTNDNLYGAPVAYLNDGNKKEQLVLTSTDAVTETLVYKRADGSSPLAPGSYDLYVDYQTLFNESGQPTPKTFVPYTTFEVGEIKLNRVKYTKLLDGTFPTAQENNVPEGWTIMTDSEERTTLADGTYSGNGRVFAFTNSTAARGCYFRTSNNTDKAIGSLTSPAFELPSNLNLGENDGVEIRALISAWTGTAVSLKVEVLNPADLSVIKEETFTTTVASANGKKDITFQEAPVRIDKADWPCNNFIVRVSIPTPAADAMTEACCAGFMAYKAEGKPVSTKPYFADDFSHTEHNKVPAFSTGWLCYDANGNNRIEGEGNLLQFGSSRNSSGGVMSVSGFTGMYLRLPTPANQFVLYGMGGTRTETQGEGDEAKDVEVTAPVLELPAGRLLVSYKIVGWENGNKATTWFEIFPYSTATDYKDVDTKADIRIEAKCSESTLSGSSAGEPILVSKMVNIPEDGRYVIKLTAEGQALFGNIKIERVSSVGTVYKNTLYDWLDQADAEEALAAGDPNYASQTLTNLQNAIANYKNNTLHNVSEYEAAYKELESLIKAMKTRRDNVNNYVAGSMADLNNLIKECEGTKFENLSYYKDAVQVVSNYDGVPCTSLSDEQLAEAVKGINGGYKCFDYMVKTGVGILTQQIDSLASILKLADAANETNESVVAAGQAITDDQAIAIALKKLNTIAIYKKIANGYDFKSFDELIDETAPDSIDITPWIQNAQFYTTSTVRENVALDAWPGWTIEKTSGDGIKTGFDPGWDKSDVSEEKPIVLAPVKYGYYGGDADVSVYQKVTGLPVGTYTLTFETMDASFRTGDNDTDDRMDSYIFAETKVENDTAHFSNETIGTYYDFSVARLTGIKVSCSDAIQTGRATIGGRMLNHASFAGIRNAHLYLTGAAEGFDYAKAAQEYEAAGLENVQDRTDAPVAVSYFNLNGQEVAAPQGVSLKVERYSDGYVVVKKVIVK